MFPLCFKSKKSIICLIYSIFYKLQILGASLEELHFQEKKQIGCGKMKS